MDLRRIRTGEVLAGIGGAALLASLFLPWFSSGGEGLDGWHSLRFTDLFVAVAGFLGLALPLISATQAKADLPISATATAALAGFVAGLLVAYRLLDPLGEQRDTGIFLALAGAGVVFAAAWRTMSSET
jgi:hypothetical protein